MLECESLGQYERSAFLAVMHGDLRAAVAALQVSERDTAAIKSKQELGAGRGWI